MTKKDKAIIVEGLNRICADIAVIASLFEEPATEPKEPMPAMAAETSAEATTKSPATAPDEPMEAQVSAAPAKEVTYEDVRAVLAEKSRTGYRAEVKALLTSHGVRQLSEITDPSVFADLMAEAGGIGNA